MGLTIKDLQTIKELITKDIEEIKGLSNAGLRIRYISNLENLLDFVNAVKTEEDIAQLLENEIIQEYVELLK